jgi:hypothetical protein
MAAGSACGKKNATPAARARSARGAPTAAPTLTDEALAAAAGAGGGAADCDGDLELVRVREGVPVGVNEAARERVSDTVGEGDTDGEALAEHGRESRHLATPV